MLRLGLFQPSPCLSSFVASSISRRVPDLCRDCGNQTRVGESAYLQEQRDELFLARSGISASEDAALERAEQQDAPASG